MTEKQLIIAVEGTAAMGPFSKPIVVDYLDKIVRSVILPISNFSIFFPLSHLVFMK